MNKRDVWANWEQLVKLDYEKRWYSLIRENYCIWWWEIDLIFEKDDTLVFVEVRVVNYLQDLANFIWKNKLNFVKKTINYFIYHNNKYDKDIKIDIAIVKWTEIIDIIEDIYFDDNL